jgi:pyridoxal 5'-phosphate synthase pdxS subunit
MTYAKDNGAPYELVRYVHDNGKLPVVNFAAGGVATPADAALMMQLGVDGVFVGSGIFKSAASEAELSKKHQAWFKRANAIVKAVTHYNDPAILAEVSRDLGEAMVGINIDTLPEGELLASRGW